MGIKDKSNKQPRRKMRLRFSLFSMLGLTTLVAIGITLWPRPESPGLPNLSGRIIDQNGKAMPGVVVKTYGGFGTRFAGQQTTTNKHGRYEFEPIETGATFNGEPGQPDELLVGIQLEHPTHCSSNGKSWFDERLAMIKGFNNVRNFIMTPGGTLTGSVVDESGKPVPKLELLLLSKSGSYRYSTTDLTGRFDESALPAGEYTIGVNGEKTNLGKAHVDASETNHVELTYVLPIKPE